MSAAWTVEQATIILRDCPDITRDMLLEQARRADDSAIYLRNVGAERSAEWEEARAAVLRCAVARLAVSQ